MAGLCSRTNLGQGFRHPVGLQACELSCMFLYAILKYTHITHTHTHTQTKVACGNGLKATLN